MDKSVGVKLFHVSDYWMRIDGLFIIGIILFEQYGYSKYL